MHRQDHSGWFSEDWEELLPRAIFLWYRRSSQEHQKPHEGKLKKLESPVQKALPVQEDDFPRVRH